MMLSWGVLPSLLFLGLLLSHLLLLAAAADEVAIGGVRKIDGSKTISRNLGKADASAFILVKPGTSWALGFAEKDCSTTALTTVIFDPSSPFQMWKYDSASIQSIACPSKVITILETCALVGVSVKESASDENTFQLLDRENFNYDETSGVMIKNPACGNNVILSDGSSDEGIGSYITMREYLDHDDDAWLFIDLSIGKNFFHRLTEFKSTTSDPNYASSISMSTNGSRIVISGSESTGENKFRGFAKLYSTDNTLLQTFETDSIDEVAPIVNVAISGDGEKLAIGAVFPTDDSESESESGVKVYDLSGGTLADYAQIGNIIAAGKMGDLPGLRLDMSEDGSRVTVGGRNHSGGRGRVRVYKIDTTTDGTDSIELIFEKVGGRSEDHLGSSVSTSKTGKYLAVGGTGITDIFGSRTGAVQVYDTDNNTTIGNIIYGKSANDATGFSVDLVKVESFLYVAIASIFSTGESALAVDSQTDRGKVDIYKYSLDSENSSWTTVGSSLDGERGATLDFNNGRYHIGDSFGFSLGLAMMENGGLRVAVGSPFFSNVRESDAYYGVVKLFEFSSEKASWEQVAYDLVGKSKTSASGTSIALVNGGDTLAIGGGPDGTSTMGNVVIYVQDETSSQPSSIPSSVPSTEPSTKPSIVPSSQPSSTPSREPSTKPTIVPSSQPSFLPSEKPSSYPSARSPSSQPSSLPSEKPSSHPSSAPSSQPSSTPSRYPSNIPSASPSISHEPSSQPSAFVERGFMILSKFKKLTDLPMDGKEDKNWCLERLLSGSVGGNPLKMRPCEKEENKQTWFYDMQTKVITSSSEDGEFCITRNGKQLVAIACGSTNVDTLISKGALNLSKEGDATQGSISMKTENNNEFYFAIDSIRIFSRVKLLKKGTENSSFDKWQLRYKGSSKFLNPESPSSSPSTKECVVEFPDQLGDGNCDGGLYNTAKCDYDSSDCDAFNEQYPDCNVEHPSWIGDGECDGGIYNTAECGFDEGDCSDVNDLYPDCNASFPNWLGDGICDGGNFNTAECGFDDGDCNTFNDSYPDCKVEHPGWLGDGECDGESYNTAECKFDNGDCTEDYMYDDDYVYNDDNVY